MTDTPPRLTWARAIGSQPRMRVTRLVPILALLTACGDDAKTASDTRTDSADTSGDTSADSAPDTTDTSADSAADTEPDTTADTEPDTAPDTEPDSEADTADTTPDTAGCEYFEEIELMKCAESHVQILHWKDFGETGCADYYTRADARYDTLEALATAEDCDTSCIYVATTAVDFIRCDGQGRSGWETFEADGEGCLEALYRTADGIFPDLCLWATYACYCPPSE